MRHIKDPQFDPLLNNRFRNPSKGFQRLLDPLRPEGGIETETVPVLVTQREDGSGGDTDPLFQRRFIEPESIEHFR